MASDPPRRSGDRIAPLRAGLVLIGFVAAAILVVAVGTRPEVSGVSLTSSTSTTIAGSSTTTTSGSTTTTLARSATVVQVANGSMGAGLAGHYSSVLAAFGWAMKPAANATTDTVATSGVYYAQGQQEAAAAIATELKLKPSAVQPLTAAVPVSGVTGDDVVVVIGADLVGQAT